MTSDKGVLDFEGFDQDAKGNLSSISYKKRYPNGLEELSGYKLFTYFPNGNVESVSHYTYKSPEEIEEIQQITYSEYLASDNLLPYYNGVPGLLYPPKLPGKIVYQEHGLIHSYRIDYAFRNKKVSQRTLKGKSGEEVTPYVYY